MLTVQCCAAEGGNDVPPNESNIGGTRRTHRTFYLLVVASGNTVMLGGHVGFGYNYDFVLYLCVQLKRCYPNRYSSKTKLLNMQTYPLRPGPLMHCSLVTQPCNRISYMACQAPASTNRYACFPSGLFNWIPNTLP